MLYRIIFTLLLRFSDNVADKKSKTDKEADMKKRSFMLCYKAKK